MSPSIGQVHPRFADVATLFRRMIPEGRPGGASLVVMHRGATVIDVAAGTRDERGRPFEPQTLALSFSTTKGIASTLLHVLRSQGKLDYDAPVARYWTEFAQNGKERITVRQVLCHEAGLYSVRALVRDAVEMRDFDAMLAKVEAARPGHDPGEANAYHGLTYGWLVGGLVEKITGRRFADVLEAELARPLGLTGCYVGQPEYALDRTARLVGRETIGSASARREGASWRGRVRKQVVRTATAIAGFDDRIFGDALLPPGIRAFDWNAPETLRSCIPAASGTFDARSLARVYAMLANGGELEGVRLLDPATMHALATVQNRRRDRVLPVPMHWRLGYHRVISLGSQSRGGFGHFGFGGSGAFCDPDRKLSVGFVLNHGVGTPFGDARMWRLNAAILRAADHAR